MPCFFFVVPFMNHINTIQSVFLFLPQQHFSRDNKRESEKESVRLMLPTVLYRFVFFCYLYYKNQLSVCIEQFPLKQLPRRLLEIKCSMQHFHPRFSMRPDYFSSNSLLPLAPFPFFPSPIHPHAHFCGTNI